MMMMLFFDRHARMHDKDLLSMCGWTGLITVPDIE